MSTSDQQGNIPLTRKQLREMRLTGATPVISPEEAAAAPAAPAPVPPAAEPVESAPTRTPAPTSAPTSGDDVDRGTAPLTRRQAREQERLRTASVPVVTPAEPEPEESAEAAPEAPVETETEEPAQDSAIVSGVPAFPAVEEDESDEEEPAAEEPTAEEPDSEEPVEEEPVEEARPIVSPAFGEGVFGERAESRTLSPSFDELITADSTGSQHAAPNTLIFTPSPGDGSLSGPVASTGELLITGSYELPAGLGSQGHARGTTDGKDVDVVLIDGELPPASSPTPIAASSAVSTSRPAGEVIRPPAPEKGSKLMLTLAITAGGLALALAVALIVAFATNVF